MRCTRKVILAGAGVLAGASLAGVAVGQGPSYQTAELALGEARPGSPSPLRADVDYVNPADPAGKPPAVAKVVETLPAGARIDTSAVEACPASDADLVLRGEAACPPGSRVGSGEIDVDTGAGTLSFDVAQFNNRDQLILLLQQKGGGLRVPSRAEVQGDRTEGARIIVQVPPIPGGPPDGFTAIKRGRLRIEAIARAGKPYVTTPPSCPDVGYWTSTIDFSYRNGSEQRVTSRSPCTSVMGAPIDASGPRIAVRGLPHDCASSPFWVRIRIRDSSPLRRAGIRLDGRLLRATTRKTLRVRVPAGSARRRHRLVVTARDRAGNLGRRSGWFTTCGTRA